MQQLWQRLEKIANAHNRSLQLRPGTNEQAIAAAEKEIGLSFPPSFRASLLAHDGQDASKPIAKKKPVAKKKKKR